MPGIWGATKGEYRQSHWAIFGSPLELEACFLRNAHIKPTLCHIPALWGVEWINTHKEILEDARWHHVIWYFQNFDNFNIL